MDSTSITPNKPLLNEELQDDTGSMDLDSLEFESDPVKRASFRRRSRVVKAAGRLFGSIALMWLRLGFSVIPGDGGKSGKTPRVQWAQLSGGVDLKPEVSLDVDTICDWSETWPHCQRGLLILDSNPYRRLVVIDVDEIKWLDWVVETYGDTRLKVSTGRKGGGKHLFYRAPVGEYVTSRSGFIGPREAFEWTEERFGVSKIDVKGSGAYVVAPGSIHATGATYTASEEITGALLDSLPVFDLDLYEQQCAATKSERYRRKGVFSLSSPLQTGAGHATFTSQSGTITDSTVIHLAGGATTTVAHVVASLRPGRWQSCFCPFHENHDSPAAAIKVSAAGRPYLRCFGSCDTIWWVEAPSVHPVHLVPERDGQDMDLPGEHRAERYLSTVALNARVTYLRSMRDSGKTTRMVDAIEEYMDLIPLASMAVILCRRALVNGYVQKLQQFGFVDYRDPEAATAPLVVCCLDSIEKLRMFDLANKLDGPTPIQRDITFIDESEQVIRHIAGETIARNSTPERIVYTLGVFARNSRHVVWADADLSDLTMRFSRRLQGWDVEQSHDDEWLVDNVVSTGRSAILYPSMGHLDLARRGWWKAGERLAIFSTTRAEAKRIAADLRAEQPDAKVVEVHADTSQRADIVELLRDPDEWIAREQPDAIVYSPSMGAGVDISIRNYWDRVLAYVNVGPWTNLWDTMQGLERIRNPKVRERAVWVEDRTFWAQTNHDIVRGQVLHQAIHDRDLSVVDAPSAAPCGDPDSIRIPVDRASLDTLVDIRVQRARGQGNIASDIVREMHRLQWGITWLAHDYGEEEKDEEARARKVKRDQKDREVHAIQNAAVMDVDRAYEIIRTGEQVDDDVMLSAKRTIIGDICGPAIEGHDVREWLAGRLRRTIATFGVVRALQEKEPNVARAIGTRQIDRWLVTVATHPARYRGQVFAAVLKGIYRVELGRHPVSSSLKGHQNWVSTFQQPIKTPTCKQLANLRKLIPTLRNLGIWSAEDPSKHPFEILGRILREMGLTGKSERVSVRKNGKVMKEPTGGYMVNVGSVERMHRMADRWVERVLDQLDKREDPDGYRVRRLPVVEDPAIEDIIRLLGGNDHE